MQSTRASAEHWRTRAKEARALADEISDPDAKAGMLAVADNYDKIAKRAENDAIILHPGNT